jgi:hypothetical protein
MFFPPPREHQKFIKVSVVSLWRRTLFYGILYLLRIARLSGRNTGERFSCLMNGPDEMFLLCQVSHLRAIRRNTSIHNMMHSLYRKINDKSDERDRINENSSNADTHDDETLCKPCFSSLLNGRRTPVQLLCVLPRDTRRMIIRLNQEAGGVCPVANIHPILERCYPPPPG